MYLIFRSKDATAANKGVLGVEVMLSKPTFITTTSGMVYVDLSSWTSADAETYVKKLYNNIDVITINVKVGDRTSIGTGNVVLPTPAKTTRKIDDENWKSCAPMAWARLLGTANLYNL